MPPFALAIRGSGGRRFKSTHPDFVLEMQWSGYLSDPKSQKWLNMV